MNLNHPNYKDSLEPDDRAALEFRIYNLLYRELVDRRLPLLEAIYNDEQMSIAALIGVALSDAGVRTSEYFCKLILEPDSSITLSFQVSSLDAFWERLGVMADVLLNKHGVIKWSIADGVLSASYCYCPIKRVWQNHVMEVV